MRNKNITNVLFTNWNLGDYVSSPFNYFDFPNQKVRYQHIEMKNLKRINFNTHIVIGGGGLFGNAWNDNYNFVKQNKQHTIITWGTGYHGVEVKDYNLSAQQKQIEYEDYEDMFDLRSTRDYNQSNKMEYVPCASCMFEGFDKQYQIKNTYGLYVQADNANFDIDIEMPIMTNKIERTNPKTSLLKFQRVLNFLGSCETVITNSYHGTYWSILLGKKVLCFPFSTKFFHMEWQPTICRPDEYKQYLDKAKSFDGKSILEKCRKLNQDYYEKVKQILY